MKAVVIRQHGDAKTALQLETDWPKPTLKPNQVLVQNSYAGLNFIDTYFRTGLYKAELPFVGGNEGGGVIAEIHPSISADCDLKVGDTVVYTQPTCSYAEYAAVNIAAVVQVPTDVSLELALPALGIQGLTAHYLVCDAPTGLIAPGDWCLIYSVASGTGQWAAQMAKLQGYKVIGTTSKGKTAPANCCDLVIELDTVPGKTYSDYTSVNIVEQVLQATHQQGVKLILDGVGKATIDISIACLARRGILVSFGNASGAVPPVSLLRLVGKSAYVTRPKLNDYIPTPEQRRARCQEILAWMQQGQLQVSVDKIFPLDQVADGHEYLESGQSRGKVLFKI